MYDLFVQLCPVVCPVTLAETDRAKQLIGADPNLGVRDAVRAAVMMNKDIP